jgi:hypothetical protein
MNDYKKLLTVVLLFLTVASFVSAQNRTKVGQLYLGASFEKNFPASYQPQFLAYLAEPGVSPHPNRSRDAFIKLQNGAADGEIDYQDDPDDNTTVTKLITFHDHRLTSILYMFEKDTSYQSQYRLLVAKYGKPFATETEVLQNRFGARWNCRQTFWHLANGDTIVEFEDLNKDDLSITVGVGFDLKDTKKVEPSKSPY